MPISSALCLQLHPKSSPCSKSFQGCCPPGHRVRRRCPPILETLVLPAGTGLHRHVGVHFQNHIPVLIQEENSQRVHLVWNTAGFWDAWDYAHSPDDALDGGVVGRTDNLQGGEEAWLPQCSALPPTTLSAQTCLRPWKRHQPSRKGEVPGLVTYFLQS